MTRKNIIAVPNLSGVALLLLYSIFVGSIAHAQEQQGLSNYPVRNDLQQDRNMSISNGGALSVGAQNVLVDQWGQCRWLDNADNKVYLVPYRSSTEWAAFLNHAPALITRARCCPARTVSLTASDGQSASFDLDTGRVGAGNMLGVRSLSHVFTLADASTETVSEIFVCQDGVWTGQGVVRDGEPVEEPEVPETPDEPVLPEEDPPVIEAETCVPTNEEWNFFGWYESWEGACAERVRAAAELGSLTPAERVELATYSVGRIVRMFIDLPPCPAEGVAISTGACITRVTVRDSRTIGNMGPMPWYCSVKVRSCSGPPELRAYESPFMELAD
ncbi:MAG: hypothetical protein AB7G06_03825 [Bdellovibrionales bacterium]